MGETAVSQQSTCVFVPIQSNEFIRVQKKHDQVETHGIDENRRQNCGVGRGDCATNALNPDCLQLGGYSGHCQLNSHTHSCAIPCRITDQCPRITSTRNPMIYRFWDQIAILRSELVEVEWAEVRDCTYVLIERLILASPTEASPARELNVYKAWQLIWLYICKN